MKRKLIKQGGGGYTIYLPKKWVEAKGLDRGDYVDLVETENSLVIGSSLHEDREIRIRIGKENRGDIRNILTHLYRNGLNRITLDGIDKDLVREVKEIVKDLLLGFELVDRDEGSCTLENISEPTNEKYEVMLKRVFFLTGETIEAIKEDLESKKFNSRKEVEEMKKNHDKFILFCRRLLIKEKHDRNLVLEWELLTFLMHIQHSLFYLYGYLFDNKVYGGIDFIDSLNKLKEYYELFKGAYFKRDINLIHKINNLKKKYHFGETLDFLETSKGKETIFYSYMRELFRLIQIGTSPLLTEILSKKIED